MRNLSYLLILTAGLLHGQTYPGAVYTPLLARDNISTALSASMLVGDSTATVSSGTGWAANMVAYICDGGTTGANKCTGTFEAMLVTNVVGNALTVTRGYGGTSAHAHTSGRVISNSPAAVYNTSLTNEVVAIETALGPSLSNIAGYRANAYDFTPQTPGGTLSAGAQSITLTPCPYGVAGAFTTSYLYLVGGTGTAEAVPIIGGTCTGGAASGTVIVTVANSHSGAWTVRSASNGLQEVLNALPCGTPCNAGAVKGTVSLDPTSTITLHTKVTFPVGTYTLDGQNFFNQAIARASDYPNGDLLYLPNTAIVTIKNMWISNGTVAAQTSGAGIAYAPGADADLYKVNILGGYYGYDFNGTSTIDWEMCGFNSAGEVNRAGVWVHDTSGSNTPVNSVFHGGNFTLSNGTWGILIQAADGLQLNDLRFGHGSVQVYISLGSVGPNPSVPGSSGNYISSIQGTNLFLDNATQNAIKIDGPAGTMGNIHFDSSIIQGDGNGLNTYGLDVCYSNTCASNLTNWSVKNSTITSWGKSGVAVGVTAVGGRITANALQDNNINNNAVDGGIKLDAAISGITVGQNRIYNTVVSGHQKWGIIVVNAGSDVTIADNAMVGNETAPITISGTLTNSVLANNAGINSGVTFANLPANAPNGTVIYVTDSNVGCTAGGSSGNMCSRVAGAWTH